MTLSSPTGICTQLIKNGYDADATFVRVTFEGVAEPGGTLRIEDDGGGMSREELIQGFMRISTAEKVREDLSPLYRRPRAGRKGIGRFAAQRLGRKLTVLTRCRGEDSGLRVEIDWGQFEGDRELVSIANSIATTDELDHPGTMLVIEDAVEAWTDRKVRKVQEYVLELFSPQVVQSSVSERDHRRRALKPRRVEGDPGFDPEFLWEGADGMKLVETGRSSYLEHAVMKVEAWVDDVEVPPLPDAPPDTPPSQERRAQVHVRSGRYDLDEVLQFPIDTTADVDGLNKVHLHAWYFILDKEHLPSIPTLSIRKLQRKQGGIRLFRNGFRVQPYGGGVEDDWLGLNRSYGKRGFLVPHRTNNFFGWVEVQDRGGQHFDETLSREGLIENAAFQCLVDFAFKALIEAVRRVTEERGRKSDASGKDDGATIQRRLGNIAKNLQSVLTAVAALEAGDGKAEDHRAPIDSGSLRALAVEIAEMVEQIREVSDQARARETDLLDELGLIRILASVGQMIGEFTHEVRHDLSAMNAGVTVLRRLATDPTSKERVRRLAVTVKSLLDFSALFDETVSASAHRELESQDVEIRVLRFKDAIAERCRRQGITVSTRFRGIGFTTVPMHRSEWQSILFNLYTNAERAIAKQAPGKGRILIRLSRVPDTVTLEFLDNGTGIPEPLRANVFDAFVTTTPPKAADASPEQLAQGSGLGLKIVRDIVRGYGGDVGVADSAGKYATCIRVTVPAAARSK